MSGDLLRIDRALRLATVRPGSLEATAGSGVGGAWTLVPAGESTTRAAEMFGSVPTTGVTRCRRGFQMRNLNKVLRTARGITWTAVVDR